ncbi:MAG: DNA-formamidopyrimidine glycosylase family protein [Mobilicoccus sp.]|nr:DNA-formamidopyrimidine glycosylase family protein [Mobilicoccus sp.]
MPELPEVQALADFLTARLVEPGRVVVGVELASIAVLKTYALPPDALAGLPVTAVRRHGKFIDLECEGVHLVFHLAKAGWLRWTDELSSTPLRPGKSPIAVRVRFDDGSGFDLTEAGTKKSLAVYVVADLAEIPRITSLGTDPLSEAFTVETLAEILGRKRAQVKGVLRDQSVIAGIGNAYSDEILHVARLSPFALTTSFDTETTQRLYTALRTTLEGAVAAASGRPAAALKDAKREGMRVHGRTGQTCGECGDVIREVSFADSSLQYCATCQTGGTPLADRRMSRLLK